MAERAGPTQRSPKPGDARTRAGDAGARARGAGAPAVEPHDHAADPDGRAADPPPGQPKDLPDRLGELGAFIRQQRNGARLSLRRLSELAGVSNPYLSQIERGLRRPSAEILQQIARGLRISAETLYVQAGILDPPRDSGDLTRHIVADGSLTDDQKQVLVRIYRSFRRENAGGRAGGPGGDS